MRAFRREMNVGGNLLCTTSEEGCHHRDMGVEKDHGWA